MAKINIRFGVIILMAMFPLVMLVLFHSFNMITDRRQVAEEMAIVKKLAQQK